MADGDRDAWVKRVLGVDVAGHSISGDAALSRVDTLRLRLEGLAPSLWNLSAAGAPEFAALAGTRVALTADLAAPDAAARVEALETAVAAALGTARAAEARNAVRRPIDSAKLLLRWRDAQSAVAANIVRLGQAVLARDDVRKDPRLPRVEAAVAALPGLIPKFGTELDTLLDKSMNAGSHSTTAREGLKVISGYRQSLAGASRLLGFEKLAAANLGGDTALISALDRALGDLEEELRATA